MDDILKSKVGRVSKTPIDKPVSADRDIDNTDAQALQNMTPAAEKREVKQLGVGEIGGNPSPYSVEVSEMAADDGPYKRHLTDTSMKISGSKGQISSECITVTQHKENFDLESACDEDVSVCNGELIVDDGCLDYETSSVSVDIFTDRAMSEESLTEDKPEEDASYCHGDSQTVENGKLSLKLETVGMSISSDDETALSANVGRRVMKPAEEKLLQEKQYKVSGARTSISKNGTLKTKIRFPEVDNSTYRKSKLGSGSSNKNSNTDVSITANKHISETAENLGPLQLDRMEVTESGCLDVDEDLQQCPTSGQSSPGSRQSSSLNGVISRHGKKDNNDVSGLLYNRHISETAEGTQHPRQIGNMEAVNTGYVAADENFKQLHMREKSSPLSSQKASQSRIVSTDNSVPSGRLSSSNSSSRNDSSSDWHLASMFYEQSVRDDECNGKESKGRNSDLKLSSTKSGKSSVNSSRSDSSEAPTPLNDGTTSDSCIPSANNSDWHVRSNLFEKSASDDACSEGKSNIKQRSVRSFSCSASSSDSRLRSANYQDSAADGDEERKSDVTPSPRQHLDSSHSSFDWHLSSMFYEESVHDDECSGRECTGRNSSLTLSSARSGKSSVNSSEWHIKSLLFENSGISSSQLSGDLHAWLLSAC